MKRALYGGERDDSDPDGPAKRIAPSPTSVLPRSFQELFLNPSIRLTIMKHLEEQSLANLARVSHAFLRLVVLLVSVVSNVVCYSYASGNAVWIPRLMKKYGGLPSFSV
jgi:hypothetical protein